MKLENSYTKCAIKLTPVEPEWTLVSYYIKSLGWNEEEACKYALSLFHDGTITQIKLIGKDGKEL